MTNPKPLAVDDVVLLGDGIRGVVLEVLSNDKYLILDNVYFKKWTYERVQLRRYPSREGGK